LRWRASSSHFRLDLDQDGRIADVSAARRKPFRALEVLPWLCFPLRHSLCALQCNLRPHGHGSARGTNAACLLATAAAVLAVAAFVRWLTDGAAAFVCCGAAKEMR